MIKYLHLIPYSLPLIFSCVSLSFLLGAVCSSIVAKFGHRSVLVNNPNERSSHANPTPRGGGIGIWMALIFVGIFVIKDVFFTLIAATAGLFGLLEDLLTLPVRFRLAVQLVISTSLVYLFSGLPTSWVALVLFLFWLIFITGTANFYNFMDGINGIAGLTGVVGFGLMAFFSFFMTNEPGVALMSIAVLTACLGFLPFNFPNAKVFMGDVGSIFLGFVFASFVAKLSLDISIFICLIMFLCTFYADAVVTIFYRLRRGENLMKAHRSHLYQYVSNELKLPHWIVSIIYAIAQFVFGVCAILAYSKGLVWQFAVFSIFCILFLITYKVVKNIPLKKGSF